MQIMVEYVSLILILAATRWSTALTLKTEDRLLRFRNVIKSKISKGQDDFISRGIRKDSYHGDQRDVCYRSCLKNNQPWEIKCSYKKCSQCQHCTCLSCLTTCQEPGCAKCFRCNAAYKGTLKEDDSIDRNFLRKQLSKFNMMIRAHTVTDDLLNEFHLHETKERRAKSKSSKAKSSKAKSAKSESVKANSTKSKKGKSSAKSLQQKSKETLTAPANQLRSTNQPTISPVSTIKSPPLTSAPMQSYIRETSPPSVRPVNTSYYLRPTSLPTSLSSLASSSSTSISTSSYLSSIPTISPTNAVPTITKFPTSSASNSSFATFIPTSSITLQSHGLNTTYPSSSPVEIKLYSLRCNFSLLIDWNCPSNDTESDTGREDDDDRLLEFLNTHASLVYDDKAKLEYKNIEYIDLEVEDIRRNLSRRRRVKVNGSYLAPPRFCLTCFDRANSVGCYVSHSELLHDNCTELTPSISPFTAQPSISSSIIIS